MIWRNVAPDQTVIKTHLLTILGALLLWPGCPLVAADPSDATTELNLLSAKIQSKLQAGKNTEAELANELKEFDRLLAKHQGEQTDAVANILVKKARLYLEVLENFDKAREAVETLKRDFPRTRPARNADEMLASITKRANAKRLQDRFVVGRILPDFRERDRSRAPLSIAQYKGKIVLLDFGATWSGSWVAEVPNVRRIYESYHSRGFEIIGISLDQDDLRLSGFIAEHRLPWPQFFDGRGWKNKLALMYGVNSLPANYLLDGNGRIVGKNLRGKALEDAVAKTLSIKSPNLSTQKR